MRVLIGAAVVGVLVTIAAGVAVAQLPAVGAGALLFPARHVTPRAIPGACDDRSFAGTDGVALAAWRCRSAVSPRKGTIVYLHGVADNRGSSIGAIATLLPRGFDVIAYDSRAHGTSGGDRCTYGFFEKRDLQRVIDQLGATDVIVIGHSLGAAVALQAAAIEPRIRAVVAASTFSDLRTIASERAAFLPAWSLGPAFSRAERDGKFVVDDVSPVHAAAAIVVPVLLLHGANDRDTLPAHSDRVFSALRGPKQLVIVPGAGHNDVLGGYAWTQINRWLDTVAVSESPSK
jgi:pimeloyl-ACP methyl ester carboxylesterase